MKKTLYCIILSILLCFSLTPWAFALEKPQKPNIEGMSIVEANVAIQQYNTEALEYNNWVDQENQRLIDEYGVKVEETKAWNNIEKQKVTENRAALQEQYELQQLIAVDHNKAIVHRANNESDLPQNANGLTPEASQLWETSGTFSGQPYNFLCRYIYLDDNDNYLLGEWVVGQTSPTEQTTIYSEGPVFYNGTYKFNRKIQGYTNGYWITEQTIVDGNCDELNSTATQIVFKNSDIVTGVVATFYYKFVRTGSDPDLIELYEPQYKPSVPKPQLLEKVDYLKLQLEDVDTIEVVPINPSTIPMPDQPVPGLGDPNMIAGIVLIILLLIVIFIPVAKKKRKE